MGSRWPRTLAVGAVLRITVVLSGPAVAQEGIPLLTTENESALNKVIRQALQAPERLRRLRAAQPLELTAEQIHRIAMGSNLELLAQQESQTIAQAGVEQSRAAFDPLFTVSLQYRHSKFFERSDLIEREVETGVPLSGSLGPGESVGGLTGDDAGDPDDEESFFAGLESDEGAAQTERLTCVTFNGVLLNPDECTSQVTTQTVLQTASFASVRSPADTTITVGAVQRFRWGGTLNVNLSSLYTQKNLFRLLNPLETVLEQGADPVGAGSDFPWTANFSVNVEVPLPFARNFGAQGNAVAVGESLARFEYQRRQWRTAAVVNRVRSTAEQTYWEIVGALLRFDIARQRLEAARGRVAAAARLFDQRRMTAYEKLQVDSERERAAIDVNLAWNDYVVASNALVELLDLEGAKLVIPRKYVRRLTVRAPLDRDTLVATALNNRPEIMEAGVDLEQADTVLRLRQAQMRPDVSAFAGLNYTQSNAVFGYERLKDALSNLFDPDREDLVVGVVYRWPWARRQDKINLSRARIARDQARNRLAQVRNRVIQEVQTAAADLAGLSAQVDYTRESLRTMAQAYEKAKRLREAGMISEFERLLTQERYFAAKQVHAAALVAYRQALVRLQGAQGLFARSTVGGV